MHNNNPPNENTRRLVEITDTQTHGELSGKEDYTCVDSKACYYAISKTDENGCNPKLSIQHMSMTRLLAGKAGESLNSQSRNNLTEVHTERVFEAE